MKKKFLCLVSSLSFLFALVSCGGEDEDKEADTKLYHLTLSTNIDDLLSSEQQSQLKVTYGFGEPTGNVFEGERPDYEIEELINAGATQEDINKAGVKQPDGTYWFYDQDPIFLEAPEHYGYKFDGFYDKDTNVYLGNPYNSDDFIRFNMANKDWNIEARYSKWTYNYYFNNMEEDEINPNSSGNYCYIDDAVDGQLFSLEDATTTNPYKTFVGWKYQNTTTVDDSGHATWILLDDGKLPGDYYEDSMRITSVFETAKFNISLNFEKCIDSETFIPIDFNDICESVTAQGNLTTIDNVPCETNPNSTPITKNSAIKIEYGSWLDISFTVKQNYRIWYYKINGVRKDYNNCVSIYDGDIIDDSIITIVVTDVN